jgi:hypothetical protein
MKNDDHWQEESRAMRGQQQQRTRQVQPFRAQGMLLLF